MGVLLVLVVLIVAAGLWSWNIRLAQRVEEELAKIRAAGEPVTPEELNAFYRVPKESADCTDLWLDAIAPFHGEAYEEAYGELPIVGLGEGPIPPPGEPWADQTAAEEFLEKYAESMRLMHEAARRGGAARYPIDFNEGIMAGVDARLEDIQRVRAGARMLALEARVRVRQGKVHAAAESIRTMLRLAESLGQEPMLVSQLVRMACGGIARKLLAELLADVDFPQEDLARLQADFAALNYDEGMVRAMIGERVLGIQAFQDPEKAGVDEMVKFRLGPRNADLLLYLDLMNQAVAAAKLADPMRLQAAEQSNDRLKRIFDDGGIVTRTRYTFTALSTPAMAAAAHAEARSTAFSRCVVVRIALERYRRKHGELPERLDQLVPEFLGAVPRDPFDGKPLRYIIRDGKPVLYSVGRDGADNGGQGDAGGDPDLLFPTPPYEAE